ncbi:helix-turn-helix domain-containing protein [Aeromicrobium sp. 50.2.37]|uniref:winged helix-turn-helix transcriptional regulator n=1 Tax=Aeromicrobium sp. 50.2.37 TaxID=2969305 RepID=UPI00214F87D9|nr:helix-turn-helix domain-containing protein [Aeromicrobium sp. 50.2.37]MCR4512628.1 helix-turn-helix transcriptional regulator [Aeromicrobium sp. 50.2.37]
MPLRSDWSSSPCPVGRALDVLGDPWVVLIMRDALHGRRRFDELRDGLGVADSVLSRRLQAMVEAGLLARVPFDGDGRVQHVYEPTASGADLLPVLHALAGWAEKHRPAGEGGRMAVIHEPCGQETASADRCTSCGATLVAHEVSWDKPWKQVRDRLVAPIPTP